MPYYASNDPLEVDCLLLGGQSNEEGGSNIGTNTATYLAVQPNTEIFFKPNDNSSTNNGSWQSYLYGLNNQWRTALLNYTGPDITVGYRYYQQTGRPLWIIKYAYSGSALVDDGTPYANGLWQWDANLANCNGLPHYTIFRDNFIIPAILQARARGIKLNIKALHWCQGESDSLSAVRAAAYQTTLISMINKLISDLTPYNVLSASFKPIISRIHNNYVPSRAYAIDVRTAQENVAANYSAPWINTDAYPTIADTVHWTKVAQETHGIDVATIAAAL